MRVDTKQMRFAVIVGCCLACPGLATAQVTNAKQLQRRTMAQETVIQGYACAKGYAWFYADGRLKECAMALETEFGEAKAPVGSWVNLREDGRPDFVFLQRDMEIAGYVCRGGNGVLGPTEGAMTGFYPDGKLRYCWLAAARDVQGVPCAGSDMFSGKSEVDFYEDGKLQGCKLTKDYGSLKAGQRFSQPH